MEQLVKELEEQKQLIVTIPNREQGCYKNILFAKDQNQEYTIKVISIAPDQQVAGDDPICENKLKEAKQEAQNLKRCQHSNIAKYINEFQIGQFYLIVMEKLEISLYEWCYQLKLRQEVDRNLFIRVSLELLYAVDYLHSQNFLLRNLSPKTIYFDKNLTIKLCDFGIPQEVVPSTLTEKFLSQKVNGELFYLPPEFMDHSLNKNHRKEKILLTKEGDIWVIGICLYGLAGANLFHIKSLTKGESFFLTLLNRVDFEIKNIIMGILWMNPIHRPHLSQIIQSFLDIKSKTQSVEDLIKSDQIEKFEDYSQEQETLIKKGGEHYNNDQFKEAIDIYKQVTTMNPMAFEIMNLIGQSYMELKNYDEAINYFKQSVQINSQFAVAFKNLGYSYWSKENYEEAIPYLEQSLKICPKLPHSINILGCVYQDLNKLEQAKQFYKQANELYPQHNYPLTNMGGVFKMQKNLDEAFKFYTRACEINPFDYYAVSQIASIYNQEGNEESATEYYFKSLEINPDYIDSLFNIGYIYSLSEPTYEKSIQYFLKVAQIDPKDQFCIYNLGVMYSLTNKIEPAIYYYKKAIVINPQNEDTYKNLGNLYKNEKNNPEKALRILMNGIKKNPSFLYDYKIIEAKTEI